MDSTVHAVRAVAAELLRRKARGVAMLVGIVLLALLALAVYLTSLSGWWWLLVAVLVFFFAMFLLALFALRIVLRIIGLRVTREQKTAVRGFVDKLETVLGRVQTPLPFVVFRVAIELLLRRRTTLIQNVINDAANLRPDFVELQARFKTDD